jgi:hypothetical protein
MSEKIELPAPIDAYFKATSLDGIDAQVAPSDDKARVRDQGEKYIGHIAIRSWFEESANKDQYTTEIRDVKFTDERYVVSAMLTGKFPGGTALLNYFVTLADGKISRLDIVS